MDSLIRNMDNRSFVVRAILMEYVIRYGRTACLCYEQQVISFLEECFLEVISSSEFTSDRQFIGQMLAYAIKIAEDNKKHDSVSTSVYGISNSALRNYFFNCMPDSVGAYGADKEEKESLQIINRDDYLSPTEATRLLYNGVKKKNMDVFDLFEHLLRFGDGMKIHIDRLMVDGIISVNLIDFDGIIARPNGKICFCRGHKESIDVTAHLN